MKKMKSSIVKLLAGMLVLAGAWTACAFEQPHRAWQSRPVISVSTAQPAAVVEDGAYYGKDEVARYIRQFGCLPRNYITKRQAQALGWRGGPLERYAPGKSIGGDRFGNYERRLPPGNYKECDIDTHRRPRGAKRLVFTPSRQIYYTEDHYRTFQKVP